MVVDQRRKEVICRPDCMEVAGEMKVNLLHRHDLRIAAARSAALHAEDRTERGLAECDRNALAETL